jgi:hypothetical protein
MPGALGARAGMFDNEECGGGFDPDFRAGTRQAKGPKKEKQANSTFPDARIVTKNLLRGKIPGIRRAIRANRRLAHRAGCVLVRPAICKCAIVSSRIFNLGMAGQIVQPLFETAPA